MKSDKEMTIECTAKKTIPLSRFHLQEIIFLPYPIPVQVRERV